MDARDVIFGTPRRWVWFHRRGRGVAVAGRAARPRVRIVSATNRIREEQRAQRDRAARRTLIGSVVILVLAIVSLGAIAGVSGGVTATFGAAR